MGRIMPFAPRILRAYPDRTEALDPPEGLLLLGLRWWRTDLLAGEDPLARLRQAMVALGPADAAFSLHQFMRVLAQAARRPLALHCPSCPRLGADERRLLHAARLAQGEETERAEATLAAGLVTAAGASFAMGPLAGLGVLFLEAGLVFRARALEEGEEETAAPPDGAGGYVAWSATLPPATRH